MADALVGEVDVAFERERGEFHRHLLDQAGEVEGGALADHAVYCFGVRQGQHLVGQPACGAGAAQQAGEGLEHLLRLGLAQAVLGLGGEHRERGADLVRSVGEEAPARGEHRRQALHVVVDGVDQRRDLARHTLEAHRGEILLVARADVVADAQQRAEGGAERGQHQQRADRHQQGLALQAGDEQIPRQRPARAGGLGEHDQHRVATSERRVVQALAHGRHAHGLARIGQVEDSHRSAFVRQFRRAQVGVAGDQPAGRVEHGVEDAFCGIVLEALEGGVGDVHLDLAGERMGALADRTHRGGERAVVGLVDRVERAAVGEEGVDEQQRRERRQQPGEHPPAQAAAVGGRGGGRLVAVGGGGGRFQPGGGAHVSPPASRRAGSPGRAAC